MWAECFLARVPTSGKAPLGTLSSEKSRRKLPGLPTGPLQLRCQLFHHREMLRHTDGPIHANGFANQRSSLVAIAESVTID